MIEQITTKYNGTDATVEIVLIVLISMILGWLARWVYEQIMFDDIYFDEPIDWDALDTENSQTADVQEVIQKEVPAVSQTSTQPQAVVMPYVQDDLKIIEGVGPKIEQLLHEGGITTWQELADSQAEDIKQLLRQAGERYRIHDPSTWPEQAMLAANHKWDELQEFQDHLSGGKDLTKIYGQENRN